MVSSGTAVVVYAAISTSCLFIKADEALAELLASGASRPLTLAVHRASKGELSGDAAKAAGASLLSYLVRDQVSTLVIINFVVSMYALSAVLTKAMFLGPLSAIETGKLSERMLKFLMLKLVFIAAISGPEIYEVAMWVSWFAVVGWLKMFVGMARDRFDSLISSPTASFGAHARTLALLLLIFANDISWIVAFVNSQEAAPLSHLMLWLFDMVVAALEAAAILVKYGVYVADQLQERESWEGKGDFLYKVELATDMAVKSLTLSHLTHIWWLHGFAFRLLDAILFLDIRHLFCSICSGVKKYHKYRQATHNLNNRFPDADDCNLNAHSGDCAICREKMQAAKVLPCGHVFHLSCLTAWLQQSGSDNFTCPLCRSPLFLHGVESSSPGGQSSLLGGLEDDQEAEAQLSDHDVEAETFSSQVVGQALAEAARSLAEGGNSLRQNWTAEIRHLEQMVQNLRARLLQNQSHGSRQAPNNPRAADRWVLSQSFASSPIAWQGSEAPRDGLQLVAQLERQLDDIRGSFAISGNNFQEAARDHWATTPERECTAREAPMAGDSRKGLAISDDAPASSPRADPARQPSSTGLSIEFPGSGLRLQPRCVGRGVRHWSMEHVLGAPVLSRLLSCRAPTPRLPAPVSVADIATVQAILPHIPYEVIVEQLQRDADVNGAIEGLLQD